MDCLYKIIESRKQHIKGFRNINKNGTCLKNYFVFIIVEYVEGGENKYYV